VGVLLLTTHSQGETWELVYMGVTPAERGRGFGGQIVRHALSQAASGGAQRLVLAVDQDNLPGLAMYRAAGFTIWDRRCVYARVNDSFNTAR
jgi:ribosomal protein S18 acetylase RimI-like enzyme